MHAHFCGTNDRSRPRFDQFLAERYDEAFGARPAHGFPILLGVDDDHGGIAGVIGARPGGTNEPFFLEQYLDEPIENLLNAALDVSVRRGRLAEVGGLAAAAPGFGKVIMTVMAAFLDAAGYSHAVFTGTRPLRNGISRLGVPMTELGRAQGDRLGAARAEWGRYYELDPRICAVELRVLLDRAAQCVARLDRGSIHAGSPGESGGALEDLWRQAAEAGLTGTREEWRFAS